MDRGRGVRAAELAGEGAGEAGRVVAGDRERRVEVVPEQDGHARVVGGELVDPLQPLDLGDHGGGGSGQAGPGEISLDRLGADLELALVRGQEPGHLGGGLRGAGDGQGAAGDLIGQDGGRERDADLRGEQLRVVAGLLVGVRAGDARRDRRADERRPFAGRVVAAGGEVLGGGQRGTASAVISADTSGWLLTVRE